MATAKETSVHGKGSDCYDENVKICQPCSAEGTHITAQLFCEDCQDYLCQKCSTHHKVLKATRNHALVNVDEAKKTPPPASKDKCSHKCSTHKDKTVKYFCENHSYLGCSVCVTMCHKQCNDVVYIPTVAEDIKSNDELKTFKDKMRSIEEVCKFSISDVEKKLNVIATDELELKDALDQFRKQVVDALLKLEEELTRKAKAIKEEEAKKLEDLSKKLAQPLDEVDVMMKKLDSLLTRGKNCDAFVMMKREAKQLDTVREQFINLAKGQLCQRYEFKPNTDVLKVGALGTLGNRTDAVTTNDIAVSTLAQFSDGPKMAAALKEGTRVRRGKDWQYGNQDNGGLGTVMAVHLDGSCTVRWDHEQRLGGYRMGSQNAYDLTVV